MPWIKFYTEILHDPMMGQMNDHLWRRTSEFFLFAQEANAGGYLPPIKDMAWTLHVTEESLIADLRELSREGIEIIKSIDDEWLVTHFATRQDADTNAERQRRYRQNKHKDTYYGDISVTQSNDKSNEPITICNGEVEGDKEVEVEVDSDRKQTTVATARNFDDDPDQPPRERPPIYVLYEQNIGPLTPMMADELKDASLLYSHEWIAEAILESVGNNKRNWKYCLAILKRWKADGFKTKSAIKKDGGEQSPGFMLPNPGALCGEGVKLKKKAEEKRGLDPGSLTEYNDHIKTCSYCSGSQNASLALAEMSKLANKMKVAK
jgi:DnaD/phage-associated family protein